MYVVPQMIRAILITALAFGAVAEGHVRIVDVGDAADGATVEGFIAHHIAVGGRRIRPGGADLGFVLVAAAAVADQREQPRGEEDNIVEQAEQDKKRKPPLTCGQIHAHIEDQQRRRDDADPFDFDRDEVEDEYLLFREEGGKGQEHRFVNELIGHEAGGQPEEETAADRAQIAYQKIEVQTEGAPFTLQDLSQKEGKIQEERGVDQAVDGRVGGKEDEGKQTPKLQPAEDGLRIEPKQGGQIKSEGVGDQTGQIHDRFGKDDVADDVRNGDAPEFPLQFFNEFHMLLLSYCASIISFSGSNYNRADIPAGSSTNS